MLQNKDLHKSPPHESDKRFGIRQQILHTKIQVNNLPQDTSSFKTAFPRSLTVIDVIFSFRDIPLKNLKEYIETQLGEKFIRLKYLMNDKDNFNRTIVWYYSLEHGGKILAAIGISPVTKPDDEKWIHFGVSNRFYIEKFGERNILLEVLEIR